MVYTVKRYERKGEWVKLEWRPYSSDIEVSNTGKIRYKNSRMPVETYWGDSFSMLKINGVEHKVSDVIAIAWRFE